MRYRSGWTLLFTLACAMTLIHAGGSLGATFYVDNSYANNGDGTAPTPASTPGGVGAWNSLNAAQWGTGMSPGDIMEIREGTGVYREGGWHPRFSGTSSQRIIIQNYPGHDVVFEGTIDIKSSTWTHLGNGVYLCSGGTTGTTNKFPFTAWYDRGAGEERLNLIQTNRAADDTLAAGYMRYTTDNKVVAHLSDSSSPAAATYFRIPYVSSGMQLNNVDADYLTIRSNPAGGSFTIERYKAHGITSTTVDVGITYDGLNIGWVMDRGINQSGGTDLVADYKILNCHVYYCGQEGVRWDSDTSPNSLIANNHIHHVQSEPVFERSRFNHLPNFTDNGTGIRVVSDNGTVRGNTIHDMGGGSHGKCYAIDLENGNSGVLVENNHIYNLNLGLAGTRAGHGIAITANSGQSYDGLILQNNRIHNTDLSVFFDFGVGIGASDTIILRNNTFSDPSWRGIWKEDGYIHGTVKFINNIFSAVGTTPDYLVYFTGDVSGVQIPRNCAYYSPNDPNPSTLINFKGTNYSPAQVTSLDPNSHYGNPNIDLSGPAASLEILSAGGTAYDKGTSVGATTVDYKGTLRPQGSAYDIGAHEFVQGSEVMGRYVFYNNSAWDDNDPNATAADDNAIATDKTALLAGDTATFANYTSYSRGINGIMVDIAELPATPTLSDFAFRIGNDNNTDGWTVAPGPVSVTLRAGAGAGGSDRITIIWADNAIKNQWVEVTVLATANTGLGEDDVFYFGNAIADTGNRADNTYVNASDRLGVRAHPRNFLDPALIDDVYDFNRDKNVNAADRLIARANPTNFLNALKLISIAAESTVTSGGTYVIADGVNANIFGLVTVDAPTQMMRGRSMPPSTITVVLSRG